MPHCPHCHHALPTSPVTGRVPAHCPDCGTPIDPEAPRGASLATFLRPGAQTAPLSSTSVRPQERAITPVPASTPLAEPAVDSSVLPERPAISAAPSTSSSTTSGTIAPGHHRTQSLDVSADATQPAADIASFTAADPADLEQTGTAPEPGIAPSFTRKPTSAPARRIPRWQWLVLAALVALLGVQMLIADRARLAQDAYWRPLLERTCGIVRCALPAWHQPQAYTMLTRDVQPVPGAPGVLRIHATFRNDARWAQHWPAIAVSLSDADGRVAGARVLLPGDYLDAAASQSTVAAGQSGEMTVQVREPPGGVVAFAFEFR